MNLTHFIKSHWLQLFKFIIAVLAVSFFVFIAVFVYSVCIKGEGLIEKVLLHKWDWLAFAVACISLAFTAFTYHSQWKTQKNTAKITPESQKQLLYDYARHFCANLIIISALREMMKGKYRTHYPSEEHFLKLKVDMSTLHPAVFLHNIEHYKVICELQVLFRNFNEEVEVAVKHFTNPNLIEEAKERDLMTFEFKMGFFTKKVVNALNKIFGENDAEYNKQIAKNVKDFLDSRNKGSSLLADSETYFSSGNPFFLKSLPIDMQAILFDSLSTDDQLSILKAINRHIYIEMHEKNSSGSKKIYLIPFS